MFKIKYLLIILLSFIIVLGYANATGYNQTTPVINTENGTFITNTYNGYLVNLPYNDSDIYINMIINSTLIINNINNVEGNITIGMFNNGIYEYITQLINSSYLIVSMSNNNTTLEINNTYENLNTTISALVIYGNGSFTFTSDYVYTIVAITTAINVSEVIFIFIFVFIFIAIIYALFGLTRDNE